MVSIAHWVVPKSLEHLGGRKMLCTQSLGGTVSLLHFAPDQFQSVPMPLPPLKCSASSWGALEFLYGKDLGWQLTRQLVLWLHLFLL